MESPASGAGLPYFRPHPALAQRPIMPVPGSRWVSLQFPALPPCLLLPVRAAPLHHMPRPAVEADPAHSILLPGKLGRE